MYPVVCIAKCFGLPPFKIGTKEDPIEVLESSSILLIYSFVFLFSNLILQIIAVSQSSYVTDDRAASYLYLILRAVISASLHFR